eukprot:359650-Chlamydomonas_euryale.AAC.3
MSCPCSDRMRDWAHDGSRERNQDGSNVKIADPELPEDSADGIVIGIERRVREDTLGMLQKVQRGEQAGDNL